MRSAPQGAIVAVLAVAGMSASFMFTLVIPIQSELPALLGVSREDTAWVITISLLTATVVTPIAGRLGDMYGKRRVMLVLLVLMATGSVIAALSHDIGGVLVGRALQGCMQGVIPLGISILRDVLHERRLAGGIALVSATLGIGTALGLPISALVTQYLEWHVIFWLAAALGGLNIVLVLWIVPPSVLRTPGRLDIVGAIGLALGLTASLLVISRGSMWGWLSPVTVAVALGGLAVLALWAWYELRVDNPLVDLRVAARPSVLLTNLNGIAMGYALLATFVLLPQMLQLPGDPGPGFGLSIFAAGLVIAPSGIVMMLVSPIAGRLVRVVGPRILLVAGSIAVFAGFAIAVVFLDSVWHVFVVNVVVGLGIGISFAAMPILIMRAVPASETGASNGINTLMRTVGSSTASAVVAGVLAAQSVVVDGVQQPTEAGFQISFALAAGAAAVAVVLALLIPRSLHNGEPRPALPGGGV